MKADNDNLDDNSIQGDLGNASDVANEEEDLREGAEDLDNLDTGRSILDHKDTAQDLKKKVDKGKNLAKNKSEDEAKKLAEEGLEKGAGNLAGIAGPEAAAIEKGIEAASKAGEAAGISKGKELLLGCLIALVPAIMGLTVAFGVMNWLIPSASGVETTKTAVGTLFPPLGEGTVWDSQWAPGSRSDHDPAGTSTGHSAYELNDAIDIGHTGDIVYACFDGTLSTVSGDGHGGNKIVLTNADESNMAVYAHITAEGTAGQVVTPGTRIGAVNDYADHLHFEFRWQGKDIIAGDLSALFAVKK